MAEGNPGASHPSTGELERLLLGDLSASQAAPLVSHLIRGCALCRAKMAPLAATVLGSGRSRPELAQDQESQYDFPLFKAFANARRYASTMAREGSGADREPSLREVPSLGALTETDRASRDRSRCEALMERCRALRASDLETMVLTAELAVSLAEHLGAAAMGDPAVADLQARAWAELGNARRVADDFAGAASDLVRAMEKAGRGSGDPLLLARLMDLTASLYKDQRRFAEARRLLDLVHAIYEQEGDVNGTARALISMGISAGYAFEIEESIHLLTRGIALLDGRDPKLMTIAIHNLIWCLVEYGRPQQAHQVFVQSKILFTRHAGPLEVVKSQWLEGRIAAGTGNDALAEAKLLEARAQFDKAHLSYEVALVSLDLAALWLKAGRTAEIRKLIDQTITIFQTRKIRREALGMLLVLRDALRQERATEALLRTVAADLLRLEESPASKSEARS